MISLIFKYFSKYKWKLFFGDVDSTKLGDSNNEHYEMESHESFGYPPFPMGWDFVLPNVDVLGNNEIIHNISLPKVEVKSISLLLSFGWEDGLDEIEPYHALGIQSFLSYPH